MAMRSRLSSSASGSRSRSGSSARRSSSSRLRVAAAHVPGYFTPEVRMDLDGGENVVDEEEDEYLTDESDDTGIML